MTKIIQNNITSLFNGFLPEEKSSKKEKCCLWNLVCKIFNLIKQIFYPNNSSSSSESSLASAKPKEIKVLKSSKHLSSEAQSMVSNALGFKNFLLKLPKNKDGTVHVHMDVIPPEFKTVIRNLMILVERGDIYWATAERGSSSWTIKINCDKGQDAAVDLQKWREQLPDYANDPGFYNVHHAFLKGNWPKTEPYQSWGKLDYGHA